MGIQSSDFNLTDHRVARAGRELPGSNDLATIINMLRNMQSSDPRLLTITYHAGGVQFLAKPATPFLGQVNPDNAAQIVIGRQRAESTYPYRDTITIGIDALQKATAETVTISATAYVYYAITKSGTDITATLTANATYPTQSDTTFYVVLGKAVWDGTSKVSRWFQYWYGDILVPAVIIDAEDCS